VGECWSDAEILVIGDAFIVAAEGEAGATGDAESDNWGNTPVLLDRLPLHGKYPFLRFAVVYAGSEDAVFDPEPHAVDVGEGTAGDEE